MLRRTTADDLDAVLALYLAYDLQEMGAADMDADDVGPMLEDDSRESVLAYTGGRPLGFASLTGAGEAETVVDPGGPDPDGLQRELLRWVLERATARGANRLHHWAGSRPEGAARLLTEAGFVHARTSWRMVRSLDGELARPPLPSGVVLGLREPSRNEREVWALVESAFGRSFGRTPRTFDEWARAMGPKRVAVCAIEEGRLVGVAVTIAHAEEGYVPQLAVDADRRGRGVAQALLHEVFRRDQAAGLPLTALNVDGENDGARRLYEKAGMHVDREYRRWERDV